MKRSVRLSIVIPCLNESKTIKRCVADAISNAKKYVDGEYEVIVADNGSTDGTLDILKKIDGVRVINVPVRGYGAALHWGIMKSKGRYVLFGDADLSYPFSNIKRMFPLLELKPDMVLGSRLTGEIQVGAMPFLNRYFGTPILTWLINKLYQIKTTDCNSGMRIINRKFYEKLNMRNSGMEWASELLLKTALHKGRYLEVPIKFLKDKRNRPPHLSRWSDGWRHLKAIILLKPFSMFYMFLASIFLSILSYRFSFSFTVFFLLLSYVIGLSYMALRFLEYAIEGKHNRFSLILNSNRLVIWVMMITVITAGLVVLLPDSRLGSKLVLISGNVILFIWVFLIETIKTHLVNRLPNIRIDGKHT